MTTDNEHQEEDFNEEEGEKLPTDGQVSGYVKIIDAVVNPKNIIQRVEMSDMPEGKQAKKMAKFLAQNLIINEMNARRDPNHKRIGFGTLELVAITAVLRGTKRRFIDEMIQLKTIENEKDTTSVNMMSRS
jgi:hypothetical protein